MTQTPTRALAARQTLSFAPGKQTPDLEMQPTYEITDDDRQRQQKIADAWRAYNGELDPPLQRMQGQPDDNVMSNRCAPIVDTGIAFLFGKELEISCEEDAPEEAQTLLDTVWGRKERRIPLLQDLAMNGAIAGTTFLRIVPTRDKSYRLVVVDPATVFVKTAPQDCETVLVYCIEYVSQEKIEGKVQQVFYREEIARIDPDQDGDDGDPFADTDATWQVQHWTRVGERGKWQPAGDPIMWLYPFAPIFSCKNLPMPNSFWGKPDITPDLIGLNQALNLLQSNINRIEKIYGSPVLYSNGMGEQIIDIKPGKIIGLPMLESKITAVAIASDVANALEFAKNLRSDMDEQSGAPGVATGRIESMPRGNLSGIAIELLFMSLLKKTDGKACRYGELIIDVSRALFALARMSPDIDVTLAWQNPLPHDDLQSAQTAVQLKAIGVSNSTLMRNLGYDPEEEIDLSQTEDARSLSNIIQNQQPVPAAPGQSPVQPGQQPPMQGQPTQGGEQQ